MRVLVTGGAGFIGSKWIEYFLQTNECAVVVNVDLMKYSAHKHFVDKMGNRYKQRYVYKHLDVRDSEKMERTLKEFSIEVVVHMAAVSSVDYSFEHAVDTMEVNVMGTVGVLEAVRKYGKCKRVLFMSTDEVYGASECEKFETDEMNPMNPYAASKAAAERIVLSYFHMYALPIVITRSNNVFGPHQFPDKLIPKLVFQHMRKIPLTIHGDGENRRRYIYVDDAVVAITLVLENGILGQVYNITSQVCKSNIQVARDIVDYFQTQENIVFVGDRKINDAMYTTNGSKMEKLGWTNRVTWKEGLQNTIQWYMEHQQIYENVILKPQ